MKKGNFGAFCPRCGVGTMAASALFNDKKQFHLFYITSDGNIFLMVYVPIVKVSSK